MAHIHTSAYVTWSRVELLAGSRASTLLKFLLADAFRETWRTCRALFRRYQSFPELEEMLIEKSAPTDLFIWHQVTRL